MSIALVNAVLRPRSGGPGEAPDAVLVRGDRIARVGTAEEVRAAAGADTEVIDLGGRTLTPGLQDAHAHFLQMGITARRPSLAACRSLEEFRAAVDAAVRDRPGDELLAFESWDENEWDERTVPTRRTLDSVSDVRPLVARRVCGHFTVANTPALEILAAKWNGPGIDAELGHLIEDPSLHLDVLLLPDAEEAAAAFDAADALALSLGVTTSCDFLRPDQLRLWCERLESGRARVRVSGFVLEECLERPDLLERARGDRFAIRGMKIWSDGTIGGRTAALTADYADRPGERGGMLVDPDAMTRSVARAHAAGLSVAIHAIGDRAIGHALDSFAALPGDEVRGRGHRIEHAEMAASAHRERMRKLDVRPCVQPNFLQWAGPGGLYETALGAERLRRMNPFGSMLREGCHPFFGSDGMPPSPSFGLMHAVRHPIEGERLGADDALRLYTEAAADGVPGHACRGRLAAGEIADLAVFATEPSTLPFPGEADLTILGGEIAHRRECLEAPGGG